MRHFLVGFAFLTLTSTMALAAGSPAQLVADIGTLKSRIVTLKTDAGLGKADAIAADKLAVTAARDAVKADVAASQSALAPARSAVEAARRAFEQAEHKFRQDQRSGTPAVLVADQNALLAAFQSLATAQDALIAQAGSIGLPQPTSEQTSVRNAQNAYRLAKLQLQTDTAAKNTAAIANDQANLATAGSILTNAQAALIAAQGSINLDSVLADAERALALVVAPKKQERSAGLLGYLGR
ncbi:MAG: hypothetical protein JWM36_1638 [Hyphomicrobiales bacterium]|nr:hypothetical protein [Hyphomicrobiales bacterium]